MWIFLGHEKNEMKNSKSNAKKVKSTLIECQEQICKGEFFLKNGQKWSLKISNSAGKSKIFGERDVEVSEIFYI